jgi:hypothetical protein
MTHTIEKPTTMEARAGSLKNGQRLFVSGLLLFAFVVSLLVVYLLDPPAAYFPQISTPAAHVSAHGDRQQ